MGKAFPALVVLASFLLALLHASTPAAASMWEHTGSYVELAISPQACLLNTSRIVERIRMLTAGTSLAPELYVFERGGSPLIIYRTLIDRRYVAEIGVVRVNGSETPFIAIYGLVPASSLSTVIEARGVALAEDLVRSVAESLGWRIAELDEYNITRCVTTTEISSTTVTGGHTATVITVTSVGPGHSSCKAVGKALRVILAYSDPERGLAISAKIASNTYTATGLNETIVGISIKASSEGLLEAGREEAGRLLDALGISGAEVKWSQERPGAPPGGEALTIALRRELIYLQRIGALSCRAPLSIPVMPANSTAIYTSAGLTRIRERLGVDPLAVTPDPAPYPLDPEHPGVTTTTVYTHPGTTHLTCITSTMPGSPTGSSSATSTSRTATGSTHPTPTAWPTGAGETVNRTVTVTREQGSMVDLAMALLVALAASLAAWIIVRRV